MFIQSALNVLDGRMANESKAYEEEIKNKESWCRKKAREKKKTICALHFLTAWLLIVDTPNKHKIPNTWNENLILKILGEERKHYWISDGKMC